MSMSKRNEVCRILLAIVAVSGMGGSAAGEPLTGAEKASPVRWSIAVHGGAGGTPAKWSQVRRDARLDGMKKALQLGQEMLAGGATSLDTVEAVIRILEDDPSFNAGRGAVLNAEKNAELDASIMDGSNRACGAVGGVTIVKHPITLARRVMTETKHVLLAGPGADEFARMQKLELVPPEYFKLKPNERDVSAVWQGGEDYFGTVGCVALDSEGNLAAGTSTGGLSSKMPGRLGDTPLIGAGNYADNQSCALSATGTGEEFIRNAVAYDVAARMRYLGQTVGQAVDAVISETLKPNVGGVIAIGSDGAIALQHNTPGMTCGAANHTGRFDVMLEVAQ